MRAAPSALQSAKAGVARLSALEQAKVLGAATGMFGGVMSAMAGSLLTAASWIVTDMGARHLFSVIGTTLLFLTIPLIIFGACCMDWGEKDKPPRHSDVTPFGEDEDL